MTQIRRLALAGLVLLALVLPVLLLVLGSEPTTGALPWPR